MPDAMVLKSENGESLILYTDENGLSHYALVSGYIDLDLLDDDDYLESLIRSEN